MDKTREIILSEASQEMIPESLRANDYYAANDQYVQDEHRVKREIAEYIVSRNLEPWEVELAKLTAQGVAKASIAKQLGKRRATVIERMENPVIAQLTHYFLHLKIYQDAPNEGLRMQMLWRIAKRNEQTDPDTTIKALRTMNDMAKGRQGGGGFNIVINGVDLQKGALDG